MLTDPSKRLIRLGDFQDSMAKLGENAVSLESHYEEPTFVKSFKDLDNKKIDPIITPEVSV